MLPQTPLAELPLLLNQLLPVHLDSLRVLLLVSPALGNHHSLHQPLELSDNKPPQMRILLEHRRRLPPQLPAPLDSPQCLVEMLLSLHSVSLPLGNRVLDLLQQHLRQLQRSDSPRPSVLRQLLLRRLDSLQHLA